MLLCEVDGTVVDNAPDADALMEERNEVRLLREGDVVMGCVIAACRAARAAPTQGPSGGRPMPGQGWN
eukprot:gene49004-34261_t